MPGGERRGWLGDRPDADAAAAFGDELGEDVGFGLGQGRVRAGARGFQGAADGVQRGGEGDPVGVQAGAGRGADDDGPDGLVDGQVGPEFLAGQAGSAAAQDPAGAAQVGLAFAVPGLDGLITNDKFCCVRRVRLSLTWSRRPLRLRACVLQTDVALSGEPDDPDLDVDHLPPAQPAS